MVSELDFPFNHLNLDDEIFQEEILPFDLYNEIVFEPTNYDRSERDENLNSNLIITDREIDYDHSRLNSCKYFDKFQNSFILPNSFFVLFSNIRSFSKNFSYFSHSYLDTETHLPNIIGLCETRIQKSVESIYSFPGYNLIFNSNSYNRGGLLFLVKSSIQYEILEDLNFSLDYIESLFIKIKFNGSELIVGNIYRRPGSNFSSFMSSLEFILNRIGNGRCMIGGDFNLDLIKYESANHVKNYVDTFYGFSYCSLINRPTRVSSHSATIIDHLWTNCTNLSSNSGILLTDASDHFSPFASVDIQNVETQNEQSWFSYRNVDGIDEDEFRNDLFNRIENIDFDCDLHDTNYLLSRLTSEIKLTMDVHCPLIVKSQQNLTRNKNPWYTNEIGVMIRAKNRLYKKFVKRPITYGNEYRILRNRLNNKLDSAKKTYFQNRFTRNRNNSKKSWGVLNEILNRKRKSSLCGSLLINNCLTSDKNLIAEHFNNYFSCIGTTLAQTIPNSRKNFSEFLSGHHSNSLFFSPIGTEEILSSIKSLNPTSSGNDGISGKIMKICAPVIAYPISEIFNHCLNVGYFPDSLKIAKVIPLHKANDPTLATNYRPISLLNCFGKLFEKLIFKQLSSFLDENEILTNMQNGFRKGRNVDISISNLMKNVVEGIDKNEFGLAVFLDFKKAFDLVDHQILLEKLKFYGIRGTALDLFRSYLQNRISFVSLDNVNSVESNINIGVPQGSTLGPLLFLVFINDIINSSSKLRFNLFADDTSLYLSHKNISDLYRTVNEELLNVLDWINANGLCLNFSKTIYLLFAGKKKVHRYPSLYFGIYEIERKNSTRFLGLIIDEKLNWIPHIDQIASKLSRILGILFKIRNYLNSQTLLTIYYSFVFPYLKYGIIFWSACSVVQFNRIFVLQKKILRCINFKGYLAHTEGLFKKNSILKLMDLRRFEMCKFVYVELHVTQLFNLRSHFHLHSYWTRNRSNLLPNISRTRIASNFVLTIGIQFFNSLDVSIKSAPNSSSFKFRLRNCLLNQYLSETV